MSERIIDWRQQTSLNCRHAVIVTKLTEEDNGDQKRQLSASCEYKGECEVKTQDIQATGSPDKLGSARCFAKVEGDVRLNCVLNQGC